MGALSMATSLIGLHADAAKGLAAEKSVVAAACAAAASKDADVADGGGRLIFTMLGACPGPLPAPLGPREREQLAAALRAAAAGPSVPRGRRDVGERSDARLLRIAAALYQRDPSLAEQLLPPEAAAAPLAALATGSPSPGLSYAGRAVQVRGPGVAKAGVTPFVCDSTRATTAITLPVPAAGI
jgi:hypothetical protein